MKDVYAVKSYENDSIVSIFAQQKHAYDLKHQENEGCYVEKHILFADIDERNQLRD